MQDFYIGAEYLWRSNRRAGLSVRIAEEPWVSAVEEVRLESHSGFLSLKSKEKPLAKW